MDSLDKGKSIAKYGIPVAFLIEKTYNDYRLRLFINGIRGQIEKIQNDYYNAISECQNQILLNKNAGISKNVQ